MYYTISTEEFFMLKRYEYLAPVILRVALGAIFVAHGLPKLTSPDQFVGFFAQIGIPAPAFMTIVAGLVEAIGGLLLVAGYGTRIAALLLACTMLVAIITAKRAAGFVGGWEFEILLLAGALSLVLSGPRGVRSASEQA
jgi:putative oxidoreductase